MTITHRISIWSYNLKNIFLKCKKTFRTMKGRILFTPFRDSSFRRKKRVFGKIMFWFKNEKVVHMWNEMSEHNFNFVRILKVKSNFNQARMMLVEVNSLRCELWTIPQMRTFHFWDIFLKYIKFNHEEKKKKLGKRKWCYRCEPLHSFGRK